MSAPTGEFAVVVEDLRIDVSATGRRHRRRGLVPDPARRGARARRRVRIGQDDGRAGAARPHAPRRPGRARAHLDRGPRRCSRCRAEQLRVLRGAIVSYVPQDPGRGAQSRTCGSASRSWRCSTTTGSATTTTTARTRVAESLAEVALPSHDEFLRRYPHQLSGGQQQRVGLAMAFACRPRVIVLDEPTTGLDVTTQAHVLGTVRDLCGTHGVAALYVSHDLAVIADLADRVAADVRGAARRGRAEGAVLPGLGAPVHATADRGDPRDERRRTSCAGIPRQRAAARASARTGCFFAPRCDWVDRRRAAPPSRRGSSSPRTTRCAATATRRCSPPRGPSGSVRATALPRSPRRRPRSSRCAT